MNTSMIRLKDLSGKLGIGVNCGLPSQICTIHRLMLQHCIINWSKSLACSLFVICSRGYGNDPILLANRPEKNIIL